MPLDDLVGAPEVGDPRVRLKASKVNGRTVLPLTRTPGGVQAWKIIVPASNSEPAPKSHEGHEWLYVLSGRMRLVLGDHDLVLGPGAGRVRHPGAALVRKHRRPASGDPQLVLAAGRARARLSEVRPQRERLRAEAAPGRSPLSTWCRRSCSDAGMGPSPFFGRMGAAPPHRWA